MSYTFCVAPCARLLPVLAGTPTLCSPTHYMNDAATTLDRLVAKAGPLYSLPAVAIRVLELTDNPQVDTRALKECIENDPALTTRILGVVNSSLFGLSREVCDLNQALAMLGSKPLKLLVLGFSLPAGLFAGLKDEILGRYWRHTLIKAVAGREISQTLWHTSGDDAFIAGLLQDVGMLLLIQEVREPYVKFLVWAQMAGQDLAELEIRSLGFDHTELSSRLLAHWGLPEMLVEAVPWNGCNGRSHRPRGQQRTLRQILHLAELVARLLADGRSEVLGELLEVGRQYGDFSDDRLEALVESLQEKTSQLAEILSLQLPEGLDYRDVLLKAHAQLAKVAGEAAGQMFRHRQAEMLKPEEESLLDDLRDVAAAVASASGRLAEPPDPPDAPPAKTEPSADAPGWATTQRGHPAVATTVAADPALLGKLAVGVAACRQSRCPLSLLLVQFDGPDELPMARGVEGPGRLQQSLEALCRQVDHPGAMCLAHGATGLALILPDCERHLAVELGNRLLGQFRRRQRLGRAGTEQAVCIAVGTATVALPPKNFPPEDLFVAANRCLYGSRASGGGVVKSIEIY